MSSLSRSEITRLRGLRTAKVRKEEGQFVAEGTKILAELERSDHEVISVYCTESFDLEEIGSLKERATIISAKTMTQISPMTSPPGVMAVVKIPDDEVFTYESGVILLLDRISDPGNMGAILRNADWFGVERVICLENCVDIFNPKVVQASMGSLFRLKVDYQSYTEFVGNLPADFRIVLAEKNGVPYGEFEFDESTLLVIGSESHGISEDIRSISSNSISIPGKPGRAESLNAAVASGILLSHLYNCILKSP
jgi:TrmH family RNA methyltransferase